MVLLLAIPWLNESSPVGVINFCAGVRFGVCAVKVVGRKKQVTSMIAAANMWKLFVLFMERKIAR
jgi:hypothetical protein